MESTKPQMKVERWFRDRRRAALPTRMTKFCEGSWRFLFYTCSFLCGLKVLYNKPWLWNTGACWEQYPYHTVGWDIWLYYMLGIFIFAMKEIHF